MKLIFHDILYDLLFIFFIIIIRILIYLTLIGNLLFNLVAIIYPTTSLIAVLIYLLIAKDIGFSWNDKFSVLVTFLGIATISFFVADAIWCWYYNLLLQVEVPYPSIADLFYVLDVIFSFIGVHIYVISIYRESKVEIEKKIKLLGCIIIIIIAILSTIVLAQPIISEIGEIETLSDTLALFLDVFYVVGDLLLLGLAVFGIFVLRGKIGKILLLIFICVILVIVYDIAFAILVIQGLYYDGHPVELFDLASNMFLIATFYETYKMIKGK